MTHKIERAQYAEDEARLGPEAWQWSYMLGGVQVKCVMPPSWASSLVYRRNPATYPAVRPVDANKTKVTR